MQRARYIYLVSILKEATAVIHIYSPYIANLSAYCVGTTMILISRGQSAERNLYRRRGIHEEDSTTKPLEIDKYVVAWPIIADPLFTIMDATDSVCLVTLCYYCQL